VAILQNLLCPGQDPTKQDPPLDLHGVFLWFHTSRYAGAVKEYDQNLGSGQQPLSGQ
jgi:hypothetical protein